MTDAIYYTDRLLQSDMQAYVCVTGVHGVMEAQTDERFRSILNASFLTTPDGMPTVWVGHWQGHDKMARVSGPEYMLEMCQLSVERGYTNYLYGGKPGVAEELRDSLLARFPDLKIVGTYTPPFGPLDKDQELYLERQLARVQPDILWCGISTPKQERFMSQYCGKLPVKLMVGVGAAFDVHSGHSKDAPDWVKNAGMHWFLRMLREPHRLTGRYLKNNPRFLWLMCLQLIGLRRYLIMTPARTTARPQTDRPVPVLGQRAG
ncbi:WecB/TagA/CpsF family glycosyltransferase [Acidicapsa dinghuensis]|uniref:WecB/TagA/CpsF family glycosyltransferase n=2 Tax=Acidicapsa dinghuensis TaxID=2218256 RepID=A0ABW1EJI9_9BACT